MGKLLLPLVLCTCIMCFSLASIAQKTWTGSTSTAWNTASNWIGNAVPISSDDVVIPIATNTPVIGALQAALAKSVEVQSGGVLTILSTGSLTINGSKVIGGNTTALYNQGTVNNSGKLIIGNLSAAGIYGITNLAVFNNNTGGQISIERSSNTGVINIAGSTFTNAGSIIIGGTVTAGSYGLFNLGVFNNITGGQISIERSTSVSLYNQTGTFTNAASIVIGGPAYAGGFAVYNGATFNNTGCGALLKVTSDAIITDRPSGTLTNSGTIIENASGNSNIATNTGIVQNLNGGTFTITNNTSALTTALGTIWTGCTSTNWNTASNWITGTVPTASDDVVIVNVTNAPVIGALQAALAKSVEVQSGGVLTILSTGSLTINGSKVIGGNTTALYNQGTVNNSGKLIIGNLSAAGIYGITNLAVFNNNTGGQISIERSSNTGVINIAGSTFTNAGSIIIGGTVTAGSYGLFNLGVFNNITGGQISIERSTSVSLYNQTGTFTNAASIVIGGPAYAGGFAVYNGATFNNTGCGALLKVTSDAIITDRPSGTLTNSGTIIENASGNSNIATNTGIVQNLNGGTFTITNNTSALTTALGTIWTGCTSTNWNTASNWITNTVPTSSDDVVIPTATNAPVINASALARSVELESGGILTILSTGSLTVNGSKSKNNYTTAFYNQGTVNNSGKLIIGNLSGVGMFGLMTLGIFNNNTGAQLSLDNSSIVGLTNNYGSTFNNAGSIILGAAGPLGFVALDNYATFNNNAGGQITVDRTTLVGLTNTAGTFTNASGIVIGAAAAVGAEGLVNSGTFHNSGCGALIRVSSNATIRDAGSLTNSGMIIENASGNSNITTNTGTVQNLNGGTFTITNNTGVLTTAALGARWTGCTSTNWNTASNWITNTVPTSSDDVVIPTATNAPVINASALARSVELESGGILTILSTGSLTVNGSKSKNNYTTAFYNQGTVNNSGKLIIGNLSGVGMFGLMTLGIFNNNTGAQLSLDNSSIVGLTNNYGSTFNNAGSIILGAAGPLGFVALDNYATFNNNAGGQITVDRTTLVGLTNTAGTFTNASGIVIGAAAAVGAEGLVNSGTFHNSGCGALIRVSSNATIRDAGSLTNSGMIIENASGNSNITTNTGIVQNLNGGTFTITNNTGVLATVLSTIWTGCTSTNWYTATNWSTGKVPTASDDVVIVNVTNAPVIGASQAALAKSVEVQSGGVLTILSTGSLTINGSKVIGGNTTSFSNQGSVNNSGQLLIGNLSVVGFNGLLNNGIFNNNTGGQLTIDRCTNSGLRNNSGTFTNAANIVIGSNASVGPNGIFNAATFSNSPCGVLALFAPFHNSSFFNNSGLFTVSTTQAHTNSALTNNGIIVYPQGNPIPNVTNNKLIAVPISTLCGPVTPALEIGAGNNLIVGTTWYQDAALSTVAGSYSPNTFDPTNLAAGGPYPVYFTVEDPVNGCTRTVSIPVTVNATAGIWYLDADGDGHYVSTVLSCFSPGVGYNNTGGNMGDCDDDNSNVWRSGLLYIDGDSDGYDGGQATVCYGQTAPSGYALNTRGTDCNDNNPLAETAQTWYLDADGDTHYVSSVSSCGTPGSGYNTTGGTMGDCNDNNGSVWQSALLYIDVDGDGYDGGQATVCYGASVPTGYKATTRGTDCNDNDPLSQTAQTWYLDADGDTHYVSSISSCGTPGSGYNTTGGTIGDCNDNNGSVWQSALLFIDVDGDGYDGGQATVCYGASVPAGYKATTSGTDCNDNDPISQTAQTWYLDADGDTHYVSSTSSCGNPGTGYNTTGGTMGDCNDNSPTVWQSTSLYIDADGDGYDAGQATVCYGATVPAGYKATTNGTDCNDNDPLSQTPQTWYLDADGDTHYLSSTSSCGNPGAGYNTTGGTMGDCNDNNPTLWQSASLYIDVDNDGYDGGQAIVCYGASVPAGYKATTSGTDCNDNDPLSQTAQTWYLDADGDTHYVSSTASCGSPGTGYNTTGGAMGDCNDNNPTVWQSASLYIDVDSDGYDGGQAIVCYGASVPAGYKVATRGSDCNDNSAAINPGVVEICGNNIDDNCNGVIDENCNYCKNPISFSVSDITTFSARIKWVASINAVQWQVRYKTVSQGSKWIDVIVPGNKRTITISPLQANQNYIWQIRAKCGGDWFPYSGAIKFKTLLSMPLIYSKQAPATIEEGKAIQVFPNPARGQFNLLVRLQKSVNANAKIELFSTSGQAVYTSSGFVSNGVLQTTIQVPITVASGMYVVKVTTANEVQQAKLVYSKN